MGNIYTYDYTYTTNALIITKNTRGMTINVFASLADEIPKEEALPKILDVFFDLYISKGICVDAGVPVDNDLSKIEQSRSENDKTDNIFYYIMNALIIKKRVSGMDITISAELTADVKKDEALNTVLDILLDLCLSKEFAIDMSLPIEDALSTIGRREQNTGKRLIQKNIYNRKKLHRLRRFANTI